MMALLDQGADVVYGRRLSREGETWFKRATALLFYRVLQRLSDIEIPLDTGDFRLMSRRAVDALNAMPERHRFVRGMVTWIGFRQVPISYHRHPRTRGATAYSTRKMVRLALDAITSFSRQPLRLAFHLSGIVGLACVLLLLYTLYSWWSGEAVTGWTSLMTTVLLLGSTQLFLIGLQGEYLARTYLETKRRPHAIIAELRSSHPHLYPAASPFEPGDHGSSERFTAVPAWPPRSSPAADHGP